MMGNVLSILHLYVCMRSAYNEKSYELNDMCFVIDWVRLDLLCRHNFGQNAIVGASSIMPA